MKTLLQIKSSIFSDGGQSSRLAERFGGLYQGTPRAPGRRMKSAASHRPSSRQHEDPRCAT